MLRLSDVQKYIQQRHGLEVSRQTIYNWVTLGRGGETLEFVMAKSNPINKYTHVRLTTEEKVDAFLRHCGIIGG